MIKLSTPSKMPCYSWSLQAITTCPGSTDSTGKLVDACKGCYATVGNYRFPAVKNQRAHNAADWKRPEFVDEFVELLDNHRYFRWFDSGDMYSLLLAEKILEIMKRTPWCKHWLPTRMHKFQKFHAVLAEMQYLPNVVVRLSSDSVIGAITKGRNTSTIVPNADFELPENTVLCGSYSRNGKCDTCRACWSKNVQVVAYPAHGQKMKGVINALNIA